MLIGLSLVSIMSWGQTSKKDRFRPAKFGFSISQTKEGNAFFDDPDYTFTSSILKAQVFFKLPTLRGVDSHFFVQPQWHRIRHQLMNEQFVTPDIPDYLQKRAKYTLPKSFNFYALELGMAFQKQLVHKLSGELRLSLGAGSISSETERLA